MKYKSRIKQIVLPALAAILVVVALVSIYRTWFSSTKVAFINYQALQLGVINKANDNPMIDIEELPLEKVNEIEKYDMVFINGMGLRITEEQRDHIEMAALLGHPILTTMATNPANAIVGVDSTTADTLKAYLNGASRVNYRSMLNYVRTHVDGKIICKGEIDSVVPQRRYLLIHSNLDNPDDEEVGFQSVAEYESYLDKHNINLNGSHIILTGAMGSPYELCASLENAFSARSTFDLPFPTYVVCPNAVSCSPPSSAIISSEGTSSGISTDSGVTTASSCEGVLGAISSALGACSS